MELFILATALLLTGLTPAPVVAPPPLSAGSCPTPVVQRDHGPAGGPMAVERAHNATIELNRGSIRFVEYLPGRGAGASGHDYTLSAEHSGGSVRLTLTDPRGRVVTSASAPVENGNPDAAGEAAAQAISPLLPRIREHQRRVREEEQSAIHARIRITPASATAQVGEYLGLDLELVDCDDTPLARSDIQLEHSGVGRVEPGSVATDDRGRATLRFVSGQTGSASVTPGWRYRTTEDVPNVALPEAAAAVQVEDGRWRLTASVRADGDMTTVGEWDGTFRLVDGDRVEGDGTITTTVEGTCVSGSKAVPMRISGHRADDVLYITIVGEDDGGEPETRQEESMGCAVRTLIEMPSFLAGMARLARMVVMNEPCPLRVPAEATGTVSAECAGVTFHVTRAGN